MATFLDVEPQPFIQPDLLLPEHGRGAWSRAGIDTDFRYYYRPLGKKVGNEAELSLAHWAVSAGVYALQARLDALGHMSGQWKKGIFGYSTRRGLKAFQAANSLKVDGTLYWDDAKALWFPVIDRYEATRGIPDHFLRGIINFESAMDPGAVGYFIYYPDFRGVDRALGQINSEAQAQITWRQAFQPWTALAWSADRLVDTYRGFRIQFPNRSAEMCWDAAICAHNSPVRALAWLRDGFPSPEAQKYVDSTKAAR